MLSGYPGTLGSKTGFTDAARHTIVGAAERNGRRLVVAVVRAENTPVVNWRQAADLLDYGFALPAGTPSVGTLVDAAPPAATASAGSSEPSGSFIGPVTAAYPASAVAAAGSAAVAAVLLALAALARRRRRVSRESARLSRSTGPLRPTSTSGRPSATVHSRGRT